VKEISEMGLTSIGKVIMHTISELNSCCMDWKLEVLLISLRTSLQQSVFDITF